MRANRTTSEAFGQSKISRLPDQGTTIFSGMSRSNRFIATLRSIVQRQSTVKPSTPAASRSRVTSHTCLYCSIHRPPSMFSHCENMISIAAVKEITYRQSRLCRLLGNPVAFAMVSLLANGKDLSTSEIAKAIGRSVPRTSNILGALRLAELVRYETEGRYARYRLKHPRQIRRILEALTKFVKTTSVARR